MKILVKSARDASRDTYRNTLDNKKIIIISITTPGDKINSFASRSNILDILRLSFDDIGCRDAEGIPMSDKDASMVAMFINKWKDKSVDELWVHCDAGISRSSGVAAAIMKYLTGSDEEIFNNPRYIPNSICYNKTLNALIESAQK